MVTRTPANWMMLLIAGVSVSLSGCQHIQSWMHPDPFGPNAACRIPDPRDGADLVDMLNERGPAKLKAWQANNVSISVQGVPVNLKGAIAVEAPRNFRMTAGALVGDDVDVGSNDERFWFWIKQNQRIITARHDQMAAAQRFVPIQPDWIIEALGVVPIEKNDVTLEHIQSNQRGRRLGKLISQRVSPQGTPVRKETIVDLRLGIVMEHALYDSQNRLIARAILSQHQEEPVTHAVLPNRIVLDWPMTKMHLTINLGSVQMNPQQVSPQLFAMPTNRNCPIMDLGQMPLGPQPGRAQQQPSSAVSLTGALEDEESLPSAPAYRTAQNPADRGRAVVRPQPDLEPEQILD